MSPSLIDEEGVISLSAPRRLLSRWQDAWPAKSDLVGATGEPLSWASHTEPLTIDPRTMAERLVVRGVNVKIRHPWGVFFLGLITLGIYYLVWYYKINRELRDFGERSQTPNPIPVEPFLSLLAITVGWIIIVPPFVSWYRTFGRIRTAQELGGVTPRVSPGLGFLLYLLAFVLLPFEMVYAQSHLNRLWQQLRAEGQSALVPPPSDVAPNAG
jgi:hypothetical protein